jgi:spermidine/putrescine transport system permease protein
MKRRPRKEIHHGEAIPLRAHLLRAHASTGPGLLWLAFFFLVPLLLILVISFLSRGDYGTVERGWTFENYRRLAGFGLFGFDSVYPMIFLRSVVLGSGTAALCMLAALPLAFFVGRLPGRWKHLALILVIIPFWTNLLIRTYAWQILLGPGSWITQAASFLGLTDPGGALYPSTFAVYLCMVCDYLPFMVLPLYASVEKLDWTLVEAAVDLGANRWHVFRHGILPQIKTGLVAGCILVSLPAMGQFVIPDLLGGSKTVMLGNAIQQQFGPGLDWPFGSAIAAVSLLLVILGLWLFARQVRDKELEIL